MASCCNGGGRPRDLIVAFACCSLYISAMNENTYRTVKAGLATFAIATTAVFGFSYLKQQQIEDNRFFCNGAPITIKDGDTLYWITRNHCDGNFMNALDKVVAAYGTTLTVGDTIYLPTHNHCELRLTDGGQVMEECK